MFAGLIAGTACAHWLRGAIGWQHVFLIPSASGLLLAVIVYRMLRMPTGATAASMTLPVSSGQGKGYRLETLSRSEGFVPVAEHGFSTGTESESEAEQEIYVLEHINRGRTLKIQEVARLPGVLSLAIAYFFLNALRYVFYTLLFSVFWFLFAFYVARSFSSFSSRILFFCVYVCVCFVASMLAHVLHRYSLHMWLPLYLKSEFHFTSVRAGILLCPILFESSCPMCVLSLSPTCCCLGYIASMFEVGGLFGSIAIGYIASKYIHVYPSPFSLFSSRHTLMFLSVFCFPSQLFGFRVLGGKKVLACMVCFLFHIL